MTDVISQKKAAEAVDTDFVDDPDGDVGIRPNESVKQFEARRSAERRALKKARRSDPLQQGDAKAAVEYATRMAEREWLFPLDTEDVLSTVQRLSKEILILSSMIAPPSELDAVIDLSEAGVSRSIDDPHDREMWGPDWDIVIDDLNRIERRIAMKRTLAEHADNIIKTHDIGLNFRKKTLLIVDALTKRVERLTGMMGTYGDLKNLTEAIRSRASSNDCRRGEGSGTPLDYAQVWAWHAADFLRTGQHNPWMSESESFEPWDNPSICALFLAVSHATPGLEDLSDLAEPMRLSNFMRQTKAENRIGNSRLNLDPSDITD